MKEKPTDAFVNGFQELAKNAYDMVLHRNFDQEAQDRKGNAGVGVLGTLKAGGLAGGGQINDIALGIAENYTDFAMALADKLGISVNRNWNPARDLREKNHEALSRATADIRANGTQAEMIAMETIQNSLSSAAMMTMGTAAGKVVGNAMGGGAGTVSTALRANQIANAANAAQMAPFALSSASEAYERTKKETGSTTKAVTSGLFACMMSFATNSEAYDDYTEHMGLGVRNNATLLAGAASDKMAKKWGQAAMDWMENAVRMGFAEGLQEVSESLALKLNSDIWNGTFFDSTGWENWKEEAKDEYFYGSLSGALFYVSALPSYAPSSQKLESMVEGSTETSAETITDLIVQVQKDAADPQYHEMVAQSAQELADAEKVAQKVAQGMTLDEARKETELEKEELPSSGENVAKEEIPERMQEAARQAASGETAPANRPKQKIESPQTARLLDEDGNAAGKELRVKEIAKIENGTVTLRAEDGSTVTTDEIQFDDENTDRLYDSDAIARMDENAARKMLEGYDASVSAEDYASAFESVYSAAKVGIGYQDAALENERARRYLNESQRMDAFAAGQAQYIGKAAGGVYHSGVNREFSEAAFGKLGSPKVRSEARAQFRVLDALGKKYGVEIVIRDSIEGGKANGAYRAGTKRIEIALDALDGAYAQVGVHELTHHLKSTDAKAYASFEDVVFDALSQSESDPDALVREQMTRYGYTQERAREEVIANSAASVLTDEGFIQKLVEKDRPLSTRIADFLRGFMNTLRDITKKLSREKDWKQLDALTQSVERVRAIADAFDKALETAGAGTAETGETAVTTAGESYSKRDQTQSAHYDYAKPFAQQVDDWMNGRFPADDTLLLGGTPLLYQQIGLSALPMTIDQTHVDYAINGTKNADHHMGDALLKQLPKLIANPVAIIESTTRANDSVVAIVQGTVNGNQMMAAIHIGGKGIQNDFSIQANAVTSTQGRRNAVTKLLTEAIQKENAGDVGVYYLNKAEARSLYARPGVQFPGTALQDGLNHSIHDAGAPVKRNFVEQKETKQFTRWFGQSKITGKDGTARQLSYEGDLANADLHLAENGALRLTDALQAGEDRAEAVYVKMENPLTIDAKGAARDAIPAPKGYPAENGQTASERALAAWARGAGRDGVIVQNVQADGGERTDYLVFSKAQIKSASKNVGLFDPQSDDVYFSLKGEDGSVEPVDEKALQTEIEKLRAQNQLLKEQFRLTKGRKVSRASVDKLARRVLKSAESQYDAQMFANGLEQAYNYIENADAPDWDTINGMLDGLCREALQKSTHIDLEHEQRMRPVREYLRKTRIALTEAQKSEAMNISGSVRAYRSELFGRVRVVNEGIKLDSAWQELNDLLPELFPADASETDMPMLLMSAAEAMKSQYENPYGFSIDDAAHDMTMLLYEQYFQVPEMKTFADRKEKALSDAKARYRGEMLRQRERGREKYAQALSAVQRAAKTKLDAKDAKMLAQQEKFKAYKAEKAERDRRRVYLPRIERAAMELTKILQSPTDKKHVPQALAKAAYDFVSSLRFDGNTKKAGEIRTRISELKTQIEKLDKGEYEGFYVEADPDLSLYMQSVIEASTGMGNVYTLNSESLKALDFVMAGVKSLITTANERHVQGRYATTEEIGDATIAHMKKQKSRRIKNNPIGDAVNVDALDSFHFFARLGEGGKEILRALRDGHDTRVWRIRDAQEAAKEALKGLDARALRKEKHKYTLAGGSLELTTGQVMELYELNKREQARGHIYGYGVSSSQSPAEKILVSTEDVKTICDVLTDEQKKAADALQRFLAKTAGAWGNQATEKVYGYRKFLDIHYYPIRTNANFTMTKEGGAEKGSLYRIKNLGMTKALQQGAKNPLIIGDILDTFSAHVDDMATYSAYLAPLDDAMKWYNYRDGNDSVKQELERVYGKAGKDYFESFIKNLNGVSDGQYAGDLSGKMIRNAKIAAVGFNLRVAIQQISAYPRALAEIDARYLLEGLTHKPAVALAKKYCAIALWKSWGYYETGLGKSMAETIVGDKSAADKVREYSTRMAEKADETTWGTLFNACAAEIRHERPELTPGTDLFYQAAGKRLSEVVDATQVVDSVFHRPQMMRRSTGLVQLTTAFMNEPLKSFNMLRSAAADVINNPQDGRAWKKMARVGMAYCCTALFNAALKSIVDAFRSDDDDKKWEEKYKEAFLSNAIDDVNPLGLIPGVKDVMSLWDGYEPGRLDMQAATRAVALVKQLGKLADGSAKWSEYKYVYEATRTLSDIMGIPAGSLARELMTMYHALTGKAVPMLTETATAEAAAANLYEAILAGDAGAQERIRQKLKSAEKPKNDAEIDGMIAKQLMENDGRISFAYTAMESANALEVEKYKKEVMADGFTGEMFDKALNMYRSAMAEKKPKDMEKQLNVKLYAQEDAIKAAKTAAITNDYANFNIILKQMISDSTAKAPEASVKSGIVSELKKEYIQMRNAGDEAGANRMGKMLKTGLGVTENDLSGWMITDWRGKLLDTVRAGDEQGAQKMVDKLAESGKPDTDIAQSMKGSLRDEIYSAYIGNPSEYLLWSDTLCALDLYGKDGNALFTQESIDEWMDKVSETEEKKAQAKQIGLP